MSETETNVEIETKDVQIGELNPYDSRINVIFQVIEKGDKREVTSARSGETHSVCDVKVADSTGAIILALWDEDIDSIEIGSTAKIVNGYVNVFQNSMRLSKGKYGTLEPSAEPAIEEVNTENNRSDEEHQPRRRQYGGGGGGGRGGGGRGGGGRGGGGYGNRRGSGGDSYGGNSRPSYRW